MSIDGDGTNGGTGILTIAMGSEATHIVGSCGVVAGCTDATACNYNSLATEDDGSCAFADAGYDCDGAQLDCTGEVTAILSWVGDGFCDEGDWGQFLNCETFNYDDGDCGNCADATALNYGN